MSILHPTYLPPKVWKWIRFPYWILGVLIILFITGTAVRAPYTFRNERSAQMVPVIAAKHLTLDDVIGKNLPPIPNTTEVNATVVGVDANHNGIRDDVELAIFAKYPTDSITRSAELQYAKALQMYFTDVFSKGTLEAVILQDGRAISCVWNTVPTPWKNRSEITQKLATQYGMATDKVSNEVVALVLNTQARTDAQNNVFDTYMGFINDTKGPNCDIDPTSLTNTR